MIKQYKYVTSLLHVNFARKIRKMERVVIHMYGPRTQQKKERKKIVPLDCGNDLPKLKQVSSREQNQTWGPI